MLAGAPAGFRTAKRLEQLDLAHATLHTQPEGEGAIILADPDGDHHLVAGAIDAAQPLAVLLPLDDSFHIRAEAALRFQRRLFGRAAGPLPRALALTPRHRQRLVRMVRALDGRSSGASYRAIAEVLFDTPWQSATEWKTSPIRAQTIRLVKDGQTRMNGGYLRLLAGRCPARRLPPCVIRGVRAQRGLTPSSTLTPVVRHRGRCFATARRRRSRR